VELDVPTFILLRDLVYEKTGLMFEDRKRTFVQGRLAGRLVATGTDTPRDYYRYLRYSDPSGTEFQSLIETLTTNETYFFREFPQLQSFADEALPIIADAKRDRGDCKLSIWSAACSTGDEPYTLAIILRECLDDFSRWNVRILATDIDTQVLRTARRATYSARNIKDVPNVYVKKYFWVNGEEHHVVPEIASMVTFEHLNLMDRPGMRKHRNFDFIFCRNALIYFNEASCRQVLSSFYDALLPGGYIFLGHSESVGRISAAYEMVRLGDTITYRRPLLGSTCSAPFKLGGMTCQRA
jgi:chemotaxis protein methyltransferase CheR